MTNAAHCTLYGIRPSRSFTGGKSAAALPLLSKNQTANKSQSTTLPVRRRDRWRRIRNRRRWLSAEGQADPIDRSKDAVLNQSKQNEPNHGQWRPLEITACSRPQEMSDREQVGKRQKVCVLSNRRAAVRTETCVDVMRFKAMTTQRTCLLAFHGVRNILLPRFRLNGSRAQPAHHSIEYDGAQANHHEDHQRVG
jgi:hypothetical protein